MNKDGSGVRALTNQWFTFAPAWSPRKWKIFYVADTSFGKPARGLFVMDANGSHPQRITPPSEDIWGVSCAPNDSAIAYIVLNDKGQGSLRVAKPDGSQERTLTEFIGANTFHTVKWSPDSKWIVFDGYPESAGGDLWSPQIGIVNANGTDYRELFHSEYEPVEPDCSPDGGKLAYVSFAFIDSVYYTEIFSFDLTHRTVQQLTNTKQIHWSPCWSPDSKYIVYCVPDSLGSHIWRMNADGSNAIKITEGDGDDSRPRW